jgi:signal transduction histidine kinase
MTARPVRILLVEDSPTDAELLRENLCHTDPQGFAFTWMVRLGEALERLRREAFDVVLLDLSLPDSSGPETFRRARAEAPQIPIVVMTSSDNELLGTEAVRHGIQDYLLKGQTDGPQIARAIRYAIERMRIEQDLREAKELLAQEAKHLEKLVQERTAKLQEVIGELEHFSYSITHNMRAPLRAMIMYIQLVFDEGWKECDRPVARDYLQRVVKAAQRMDKLIQDSLSFTRVVRTELPLEPVNAAKLLSELIETYPHLQPPRATIALEGDFPWVRGNEAALTECFTNVLGNAVKFVAPGTLPRVRIWAQAVDRGPMPAGGGDPTLHSPLSTLRSTATEDGSTLNSFVRLWFEDNGIGIPADCQQRIFDMFQRVNKDYEGTGIGLAIVKRSVQRMGGKVGVESDGEGSRFWIELARAGP